MYRPLSRRILCRPTLLAPHNSVFRMLYAGALSFHLQAHPHQQGSSRTAQSLKSSSSRRSPTASSRASNRGEPLPVRGSTEHHYTIGENTFEIFLPKNAQLYNFVEKFSPVTNSSTIKIFDRLAKTSTKLTTFGWLTSFIIEISFFI